MDLQVTKYVPGDKQFLKQRPAHPRYRMRYKLKKNRQRPNSKDIITKVTPVHSRDRLKRKIAAQKKEVQITKKVPPHIVIDSDDDVAQITKVTPVHPKYRRQRALKNAPKISVYKNVSEDLSYFSANIRVYETDKNRRKEAIFDKIIKQLPPNNDQYYIKYKNRNDMFTVKKEPAKRQVLKRKYTPSTTATTAANLVKKKCARLDRQRKKEVKRI